MSLICSLCCKSAKFIFLLEAQCTHLFLFVLHCTVSRNLIIIFEKVLVHELSPSQKQSAFHWTAVTFWYTIIYSSPLSNERVVRNSTLYAMRAYFIPGRSFLLEGWESCVLSMSITCLLTAATAALCCANVEIWKWFCNVGIWAER